MRILLVDDDQLVRETIRATLKNLGHEVVEAADAEGAMGQLTNTIGVQVVLTDFDMGRGKNGLELGAWVRAHRAGNVRVILMSGDTGRITKWLAEPKQNTFTFRPDYKLDKPFTLNELKVALTPQVG